MGKVNLFRCPVWLGLGRDGKTHGPRSLDRFVGVWPSDDPKNIQRGVVPWIGIVYPGWERSDLSPVLRHQTSPHLDRGPGEVSSRKDQTLSRSGPSSSVDRTGCPTERGMCGGIRSPLDLVVVRFGCKPEDLVTR